MDRRSAEMYSYSFMNRMYSREREQYHGRGHMDDYRHAYREYRPRYRPEYESRPVEHSLEKHHSNFHYYHPYQWSTMHPRQHGDGSHMDNYSHRVNSKRWSMETAPHGHLYNRNMSSTRDMRQRSARRQSPVEAPHRLSTRDIPNRSSGRHANVQNKVQVPVQLSAAAPEPPVTFPDVTEADECQMEQWRMETEEMLASTLSSSRGQAILDGCKSGSRKRVCEDTSSEFLPSAKVYINKDHARFRHLF